MKRGKSATTASELAAKLGLSRGTVGAVLRNQCEKYQIPETTARRVREAAAKYNYVPHQAAQILRRQRTDSVAVIVGGFMFDWTAHIANGVIATLEPRGMNAVFTMHNTLPQRQERELLAAISRRDAGVICQPIAGQSEVYQRVIDAGIPLVFLGDYPPDMPEVNRVVWDGQSAARVTVEHLISLRRKRIAYIDHETPLVMHRMRFEGYCSALKAAGMKVDPRWIVHAPTELITHDMIFQRYFPELFASGREHPDALMMMNDGLAIPAIDELASRGFRVPQDVAVAGMGDLPMAGYRAVGLTTVAEPVEALGRAAAEIVLAQLEDRERGRDRHPIHRVIESTKLLVRRSTSGK